MAKLTRYSDFEALKSDAKSSEAVSKKGSKQLSELESFLILLRSKLSVKKETKTANGK